MKIQALLPLAAVGALAFAALQPHAQTAPQKVGFVDVDKVIQADPGYATIADLQKKGQAELKPIEDQITAIQQKGQNASAAERQSYDTLTKTYDSKAKSWNDQVQAKLKPITDKIDKIMPTVAKAQGFSVVMSKAVAAQSNLVIYADPQSTELTDAVIAQLKK